MKHKFKIRVARLEALAPDENEPAAQITFRITRGKMEFSVPVILKLKEFDDTELVQAARNYLHEVFSTLAEQSKQWKLTRDDLAMLSRMSRRGENTKP